MMKKVSEKDDEEDFIQLETTRDQVTCRFFEIEQYFLDLD